MKGWHRQPTNLVSSCCLKSAYTWQGGILSTFLHSLQWHEMRIPLHANLCRLNGNKSLSKVEETNRASIKYTLKRLQHYAGNKKYRSTLIIRLDRV